jgi:hypothetical protein
MAVSGLAVVAGRGRNDVAFRLFLRSTQPRTLCKPETRRPATMQNARARSRRSSDRYSTTRT